MPDPAPTPYQPPGTQGPPPRSKLLRNASIGCGGLLLLAVLGIGSCALLTRHVGDKELAPVADAYFEKANDGDFHGAYADFGPLMHNAMSEVDYISFDKGVHAHLGKLVSKTATGTQTGFGTRGAWGVVVYQGHFEHGEGKIRLSFQKDSGIWKITGIHYDSPVLLDAIRSPEK